MESPTKMSIGAAAAPRRASFVSTGAMTVGLVVSVTVNVLLAYRVENLTYSRSARVADYQLKIDAIVPSITAKRLGGHQEMVSYESSDRPTVLYIFTPSCPWCARNLDNFKTLVDKEGGQYRFIGISLSEEGLADYVTKNGYNFPVYFGLSPETLKTYKLRSTPQTIVISPEAKVLRDWTGAYAGDQKSQVEAFFHVSLPGLQEPPKAEAAKN